MRTHIRLGKIYGIQIGIHFSWLIIALLIVLSLSQYFAENHPAWNSTVVWTVSFFTAILFFAALLLHELSHAAVARSKNLPVRSITLFALGGVAEISKETPDAKTEFWLGIIGPITSSAIGLVFLAIAFVLGWRPVVEPESPLMSMLVWLGYINLGLALFNMLPGFPMDGGRVLRGIVWAVTGNLTRATRIASATGQLLALVFILVGLLLFFGSSVIAGLWIAFIGWFLLNAAKATYAEAELTETLRDLVVRDLMSRDCDVVDGTTNLQTFVEEYLLKTGKRCWMVAEKDIPVGLLTSHEVKNIERRLWPLKTASDAMRPLDELHVVSPEMPVVEALETLARENVNQLPVVSNAKLEGIISREQIVNYLFTRKELNM